MGQKTFIDRDAAAVLIGYGGERSLVGQGCGGGDRD
jgi:hypothetical protein